MDKDKDEELGPRHTIPDAVLRRKMQESFDDPRPGIQAKEAFDAMRGRYAERMKVKNARCETR